MSKLPYMELYVDDFEAATPHLTFEEDGIYNRLLRLCWRTPKCSIPNDRKWICRMMRSNEWSKIEQILIEFFTPKNGTWFQKRQREIFLKTKQRILERKKAGKRGGVAKSLKTKENRSSKATVLPEQNPSKTLASRTRSRTNKKRTTKKDFEGFWKVWPRKVSRHRAEKAWEKATKLAEAEEIMAGLGRQIEQWVAKGTTEDFIPYPATWLNDGGWINDFGLTLTTPEQDEASKRWRDGDWEDDDFRTFLGKPGGWLVEFRLHNWFCEPVGGGRVEIGAKPGEPGCKMSPELLREYGLGVAGE